MAAKRANVDLIAADLILVKLLNPNWEAVPF